MALQEAVLDLFHWGLSRKNDGCSICNKHFCCCQKILLSDDAWCHARSLRILLSMLVQAELPGLWNVVLGLHRGCSIQEAYFARRGCGVHCRTNPRRGGLHRPAEGIPPRPKEDM